MLKHFLRLSVDFIDRLGFRKALSKIGNLIIYALGREQSYSVDNDGHWVNSYQGISIFSTNLIFNYFPDKYKEVLDLWCHDYRPQSGDTVIDIGAGVGDEAVVFSQLVGERGVVISIEAHPQTFDCLEKTIRHSGFRNVVALNCAVGDRPGVTMIGNDTTGHISNSLLTSSHGGVPVNVRTLDEILDEHAKGDIALLKMNIEGFEFHALNGLEKWVSRIRNFSISCHDFIADRGEGDEFRTRDDVTRWLAERGFVPSRRHDDPRPWVRDYIYARNPGS